MVICLLGMMSINPAGYAEDLRELIDQVESQYAIPQGLLSAVAKIEANYQKYALNLNGKAVFTPNKEIALSLIKQALAQGITNIDIGPMQINLRYHRHSFKELSDLVDLKQNVTYAAQFLVSLYQRHGSWREAIRYYHSADPKLNQRYASKILKAWLGG